MCDFVEFLFCFVFTVLSLFIVCLCACGMHDLFFPISYDEILESFCNQSYDTNSCSVVYTNDDIVLFDTSNGYVTMENIFKK